MKVTVPSLTKSEKLNFTRVPSEMKKEDAVKKLRDICLFVRIAALEGVFIQYEMLHISTNCEHN